jgi:hypothetical protein
MGVVLECGSPGVIDDFGVCVDPEGPYPRCQRLEVTGQQPIVAEVGLLDPGPRRRTARQERSTQAGTELPAMQGQIGGSLGLYALDEAGERPLAGDLRAGARDRCRS